MASGLPCRFFSPEAFPVLPPAYLLADLDGALQASRPGDPSLAWLGTTRIATLPVNTRRYGAWTWFEPWRSGSRLFTADELDAIVAYLRTRPQTDESVTGERTVQADELLVVPRAREVVASAVTPSSLRRRPSCQEPVIPDRVSLSSLAWCPSGVGPPPPPPLSPRSRTRPTPAGTQNPTRGASRLEGCRPWVLAGRRHR
jgi:hypothetical protein